MTLTQALALRPGQRVTSLDPSREGCPSGVVVSTGRAVIINWDDSGERCHDRRYMHYINIPAPTITKETV